MNLKLLQTLISATADICMPGEVGTAATFSSHSPVCLVLSQGQPRTRHAGPLPQTSSWHLSPRPDGPGKAARRVRGDGRWKQSKE